MFRMFLRRHLNAWLWLGLGAVVIGSVLLGLTARPSQAAPAACTWTGRWLTDRGTMVLRQEGDVIDGTFVGGATYPEFPGGSLQGVIFEDHLLGAWTDTAGQVGGFDFVMVEPGSGVCDYFTGSWDIDFDAEQTAAWNGDLVKAAHFLPLVSR